MRGPLPETDFAAPLKVVITMPAYRAERTLAKTVAEIPSGTADLLILVDDASPDNTAAVARELGLHVVVHSTNRGYGGNQKTCYTEALREGADIIVLLHPDYQYDPKAVPLLLAPIYAGDADMTFGSRFAGLGDPLRGGMPLYRYLGNRITTIAENLMLGARFTELHSGMRAYTRDCLLSLPFLGYTEDFAFDSQLLVDAITSRLRVVEVPIPTRYTKESSSIAVGASLRYIAGSLAYCARQTARRGRRGSRWPGKERKGGTVRTPMEAAASSSHRPRFQEPDDGLDPGLIVDGQSQRKRFDWIADSLGRFPVLDRELLHVGPDEGLFVEIARGRGWRAESVASLEPPNASADVVVLLDTLDHLEDPVSALRKLRPTLREEGLLAVYPTPSTLRSILEAAGFRVVYWSRSPRSLRHPEWLALSRVRSGRG